MPRILPITAITYDLALGRDLSTKVAPPYDVLDERSKAGLLAQDEYNIVAIDLPHLPPKTVGPDSAYQGAAATLNKWLDAGVLERGSTPAVYVYQQTYAARGQTYHRRGLIANVALQPFGVKPSDGSGGVYAHEQTFSEPKEDRLRLMRATQAQLSPIFGLYADPTDQVTGLLAGVIERGEPDFSASTTSDGVRHSVWVVSDPAEIATFAAALRPCDTFIADGHHRYTTALNYRQELGEIAADHPAQACLFVLVAMQDPGLIVLPTHRVLGGMQGLSLAKLRQVGRGRIQITKFQGDSLAALEAALPTAGHHALGLLCPGDPEGPLALCTTVDADPLAQSHADRTPAWRQLDVAIVQHLLVEELCQPHFAGGKPLAWKFPHDLPTVEQITDGSHYQLGVITQATPLGAIEQVCTAGELMPQKSTFFYPKLATGLVINPLK